MKKQFYLLSIIVLISNLMYAQLTDADKLEIGVGGSFAKPKIIPKLNKLAIAQIAVSYKLFSEQKTAGKDKASGKTAGAKVAAYLETTDGELSDTDFQEVTDYFYSYFQKKLKANGIDTIAWSEIVAKDFYKSGEEKIVEEKGEKDVKDQVKSIAHKGNNLYGGATAFAFGKIKKASKFCEELDAPAGFFNVTVDFADVLVNVDVKTVQGGSYISYKYNSSVTPEMKVVPSVFSLFWNEKSQAESLFMNGDIKSEFSYSDKITEDVSKARSGLAKQFAFRKEMTPVLIETTREKYKTAAKKALEKYADAFVAKTNGLRKD